MKIELAALFSVFCLFGCSKAETTNETITDNNAPKKNAESTTSVCDDKDEQSRIRFENNSVLKDQQCQSEIQKRICTNKNWSTWSGRYTFAECSIATPVVNNPPPVVDNAGSITEEAKVSITNAETSFASSSNIGDFSYTQGCARLNITRSILARAHLKGENKTAINELLQKVTNLKETNKCP